MSVSQLSNTTTRIWADIVEKYGDDEDIFLPVVVGWMVGFSTYCICGGLYLILDVTKKPSWMYKRKHQNKRDYSLQKTSYNPSFLQLLKVVLFNWLVVIPAGLYFLQKTMKPLGLGVYVSKELPSLTEVVFHTLIAPFATEVTFFVSHYWLHTKPLYKRVHKVHHDFKSPHALACIYAHWFEALVGNTFGVMGPAFFLNLHVLEWYVGLVLGWVGTCIGHSGYDLPWHKKRSNGFGDFHDFHHENFVGNYGSIGLLDWLCGTDQKWRERCKNQKPASERVKLD
mmetsp:Transcript_9128/g.10428  ORF Transcript_9128/g.10428 Transcript_9128/m.10428 type:complete len:283 (-) Transcript_9128:776-1624(-)